MQWLTFLQGNPCFRVTLPPPDFAILTVTSSTVFADLSLTVEDLITDKGKVKLDLSFAYANVNRSGVSTGEPIIVQTGPTSFVTVPTLVGESIGNSDTVIATSMMLPPRRKTSMVQWGQ